MKINGGSMETFTKKEKRHLKDMGVTTLRQFKEVAAYHKQLRDDPSFAQINEPCYECKEIARKLGLPI